MSKTSGDTIPKPYIMLFLPPDPIILDAGAHLGEDTISMNFLWPAATIHAFEPVPALFAQLIANTAPLTNTHCYPLALGAETGTARFYVSGGGGDASSSLLAPKETHTINPHVTFPLEITVPTITLDDWGKQHKCTRLDFLWLDMQGAELAMMQSAPGLLSTVRVIHLEVSTVELYENNPLYSEVRLWLENQGFRLDTKEIISGSSGNALFIRQNVRLRWDRLLHVMLRKVSSLLKNLMKAS